MSARKDELAVLEAVQRADPRGLPRHEKTSLRAQTIPMSWS
jgi:hypothetical protein